MEFFYGSIGGMVAFFVLSLIKVGSHQYIDEKAKNLATLQDIKEITEKVESVKTEYVNRSYAWRKFLDFELNILKDVWKASWELQASVRSLNPIIDNLPENEEEKKKIFIARYKEYKEKVIQFIDMVVKNQPFIPPGIYTSSMEIRKSAISPQVNFEINFSNMEKIDWRKIVRDNKELDQKIDELNVQIRTYIVTIQLRSEKKKKKPGLAK